jgi:hypothetical protein
VPSDADHRAHDFHRLGSSGGHSAVPREHDEVGEIARQELPAPPLVTREPGRVHRARNERLFHRQALIRMPRRSFVDRAEDSGSDSSERVELLDRCIGAVRDDGTRVPEGAERVAPSTCPPRSGRRGRGQGA